MAELKTQQNDANVKEFIHDFANSEQKINDSLVLLELFEKITGYKPKMWGDSIIGFGKYHYKSERSKQEGNWPLVGFSPRKTAISLYVYSSGASQDDLIKKLGKFKMGKGCIYVKKLSDVDLEVLKEIILSTVDFLEKKYGKI